MRLIAAPLLTICVCSIHGQSLSKPPEVPVQVSLCDIKANPEKYLHQLVEFTAVASHGFEDSTVEDKTCKFPDHGPGVWMEYGGLRSTDTMYCCGGRPSSSRGETLVVEGVSLALVDDDVFRDFDRRLHPKHTKPQKKSDTVRATLRGRIFARREGIMGTQVAIDWRGYGHMDCCMLFVITQVVEVYPK